MAASNDEAVASAWGSNMGPYYQRIVAVGFNLFGSSFERPVQGLAIVLPDLEHSQG